MDWKYLYAMIAFVIGGLAGFQGVYERYKKDSLKALTTLPGFFYLLTRASFPAGVFIILYSSGFIESNLLLTSFTCGTGAEIFLRTKVFIKQEQKGGNVEELLKGPLDLLRWYQNLFLGAAASGLAERRKNFLKRHLPQSDTFQVLYDRVIKNMDAWPNQDLIALLKLEVEKLKIEFDAKGPQNNDAMDRAYRFKLGYLVYNQEGSGGFKALIL